MNFKEQAEHLIESGFQLIYVPTTERERCENELRGLAEDKGLGFITWDMILGIQGDPTIRDGKDKIDVIDALMALGYINSDNSVAPEAIIVMRNLHGFLEDVGVRQVVQELYHSKKLNNGKYRRPIFIVSGVLQLHPEIASLITVVDFNLPKEDQLKDVFDRTVSAIQYQDEKERPTVDSNMQDKAVQAMLGLTTIEAENVLAYSIRVNKGLTNDFVSTIEDQKAKTLDKTEILTYVPKEKIASMEQLGGYENLKEFIRIRKLAYTKAARELNIDLPRGIALVGPPGTAKSLCGKMTAREFDLPLIIMNFASVFGSLIGESERRMREALNTIDTLDGSVVLVDEAEKALGGADQSMGDSGVARRVFGLLLTWLTEKKSRSFVILTMNKTQGIPPEFLRRGRFDATFYTDLPGPIERDQILRIHCKKRGVDTKKLNDDWTKLINKTDRFVGAELEQIICDARFRAFAERSTGQPTMNELLTAASEIIPLADGERETIESIRSMCAGKATPVSKVNTPTQASTRSVRVK